MWVMAEDVFTRQQRAGCSYSNPHILELEVFPPEDFPSPDVNLGSLAVITVFNP